MSQLLATSFQQVDKISFYNVVLFLHIAAAIVAFGVTFAYPIIYVSLSRPENRRHVGWFHRVRGDIGRKLISSSGVVILLAGIYLAAEGPYDFGSSFVGAGIVIIIVLLGLGGAFFAPNEERAAELAQRDIDAAGDGAITFSAEYEAVVRRLKIVGVIGPGLLLLAVFLMVMKIGA